MPKKSTRLRHDAGLERGVHPPAWTKLLYKSPRRSGMGIAPHGRGKPSRLCGKKTVSVPSTEYNFSSKAAKTDNTLFPSGTFIMSRWYDCISRPFAPIAAAWYGLWSPLHVLLNKLGTKLVNDMRASHSWHPTPGASTST